MPRQTRLTRCGKCGSRKVVAGVCRSFYLLQKVGHGDGQQFKRTLPTVGYCFECLVEAVRKAKGDPVLLEELRAMGRNSEGNALRKLELSRAQPDIGDEGHGLGRAEKGVNTCEQQTKRK